MGGERRKPVSAFKDEAGYTIEYSDGEIEESPVRSLWQLKAAMKSLGNYVVAPDGKGGYTIRLDKRRKKGAPHAH